jgi:alginate O-acetyltransferase complex protein AlgI
MLFNSLRFIFLFLPITMIGFHLLGRYGRRPVIAWLGLMSLVFYAAWNRVYVLLLVGSIVVNYLVARLIAASPDGSTRRKQLLVLGVGLNLLALFYFKYCFKFLLTLGAARLIHADLRPILLPLGVSFFTFTQISYLVDLAQDQAEVQDFLSYLLFVTFFPHLIAGPILHHSEMMPQFSGGTGRRFGLDPDDVAVGSTWFLMGLAKKVLIADKLAPTADIAFGNAGSLSAASAWVGLIAYTMQLYFDFSGYSDMALGLARMFSIRFPLNFDSPYKATSVTEYWQRWHMTLTRYITQYLYNPILMAIQRHRLAGGGGSSRKAIATFSGFATIVAFPTMVTMLLTGIWHGAGLQFVLFGVIHGVYLMANQAWRHFRPRPKGSPAPEKPAGAARLAMMIGVYLQVAFALIFFRSESLGAAVRLLADMFGRHGIGDMEQLLAGSLAFALFPVVWFFPNTQQILGQETGPHGAPASVGTPHVNPPPAPTLLPCLRWRPNTAWLLLMVAIFFASLANLDPHAQFLYFQF